MNDTMRASILTVSLWASQSSHPGYPMPMGVEVHHTGCPNDKNLLAVAKVPKCCPLRGLGNCADAWGTFNTWAAGALKPVLAVSGYLEPCVQARELMLTVGEVASEVCGLNELAIVLFMLTHGEVSVMLLILEVVITLWAFVTFKLDGVLRCWRSLMKEGGRELWWWVWPSATCVECQVEPWSKGRWGAWLFRGPGCLVSVLRMPWGLKTGNAWVEGGHGRCNFLIMPVSMGWGDALGGEMVLCVWGGTWNALGAVKVRVTGWEGTSWKAGQTWRVAIHCLRYSWGEPALDTPSPVFCHPFVLQWTSGW